MNRAQFLMPDQTLTCKFTCLECNLTDAQVFVKPRLDGQDVANWMETVCIPTVCEAHNFLSPHCKPEALTSLWVPLSSRGVGFLMTGDETPANPTEQP